MRRGIFVTGTDTGVGKTIASCALVHAFAARGLRVMPMKPIAAGAAEREDPINEDTLALLEAAGLDRSWAKVVTPVLLAAPMSPHLAAAKEGRTITLAPVRAALERALAQRDLLLVEGVGGFRVPLADGLDTVDLARELGLPVVLVVGMRLGCLNHALLTAQAIDAAGLRLAGWIANQIDARMEAVDANVATLDRLLRAPRLGRLPFAQRPDPRALAARLDVSPLLA